MGTGSGDWRARHGWAAGRRDEILARVAAETIWQKAPGCRAALDASGRFLTLRTTAGTAAAPGKPDPRPAPATPAPRRARGT